MNVSRRLLLPPKSTFHFIWRTINQEFFFATDAMKTLYLTCVFGFMKRARGNVLVYSYCLMSNHFHMAAHLKSTCDYLAKWFRSAHSSFVQQYNKIVGRKGPGGMRRPKTLATGDEVSLQELQFYLDWNPVAAGIVSHPSEYKWCTYNWYAHGKTDKWTKHLTQPQWYLDLGDTPEERQAAYRILSQQWWDKQNGREPTTEMDEGAATGPKQFREHRERLMKAVGARLAGRLFGNAMPIPRKTLHVWVAELVAINGSLAGASPVRYPPGHEPPARPEP